MPLLVVFLPIAEKGMDFGLILDISDLGFHSLEPLVLLFLVCLSAIRAASTHHEPIRSQQSECTKDSNTELDPVTHMAF